MPSDFLKNDNWEFLFNLFAAQLGVEHERREQQRAAMRSNRGR